MAIFQDPSTPALTSGFGNAGTVTTLQTPTFSPPAGSLIVVLVAFDYLASNPTGPVFTVTDSVAGTYTAGPGVYDTEFNRAQIWYRYLATAPGSITVTVTNTGPQATHGWIIQPYVLDGASPVQTGAASATASSVSTSQVPWSGTITTTSPGSWVLTAVAGGDQQAITPLTGTTTLSDTADATEGATYLTGRNTTVTVLPGAVTPGWTPASGASFYDYAWAALEILAASMPLGLPPLSVKRFPYRRAVVGWNGSCAGGVAVPPATPYRGPVMPPMSWMGSAGYRPRPGKPWIGQSYGAYGGVAVKAAAVPVTAPQPRPFVARRPAPARAVCGPRPQPSGGVASPVVTPQGAPPSPLPRPVIVHLPPHRAKVGPGTYLATGRAGVQTPLGFQAQPAPRPVIVHVPPARARLGSHGQAAGGVPSAVVTPLGSPSQPAPRPVIVHVPPHRVVWRGRAAQNYPVAVPLYQQRPFIFRSPLPARARLGNSLQSGDGYASPVVTPLGSLQAPRKVQVAPPRITRARVGTGQVAGGLAVTAAAAVPVTAYQRPAPQVRRPAPARAWTGRGVASPVITPQGPPGPPRPFVWRSPARARARLGNNLQAGDGYASHVVTPQGSPSSPLPRPVLQHVPPHHAVWRGLAAQNYPPAAAAYQRKPFVFRPPLPARARLGRRGLTGTGITGPGSGTTYYVSNASPVGSDSNPGTLALPWLTVAKVNATTLHPGDTVLFNGGNTFTGTTLAPTTSGTAVSPITVGSYGTGNAVFSNGTGDAILLSNVGGYTFQNLTLTGISGSTAHTGIEGFCSGSGQLPAVTITSCTATGWNYGVIFGGAGATDGWNGFTVTGCTFTGNISAGLSTYCETAFSTAAPQYNFQNVTISNCVAHDNPGSASITTQWSGTGIVIGPVNGGTITGCTAYNNGALNGDTSAGPVGIFTYSSNNVTITSCVAYSNQSGTNVDGDGFDIDIDCTNCTIEYCIAYSNGGAGILAYGGTADTFWSGNTIRYNLCWGNGQNTGGYGEISLIGNLASGSVYGNTCVARDNGTIHPQPLTVLGSTVTGITVRNNIFYASATGLAVYTNAVYTTGQLLLQGNCYYSPGTFSIGWGGTGYSSLALFQAGQAGQEKVSGSPVGLQANPLLIAPGTVPAVTSPSNLAPASGLQLQAGSPAAGAGLNLQSLFSVTPGTQDFFGDPLSLPLWIGAYQGIFQYAARGNPGPVIQHFPRSQPPARARTGSRGNVPAAGRAGAITPQGVTGPPRPFIFRSPAPSRGHAGSRAAASGGITSPVITPQGSPSSPAPRPVLQHLPPNRGIGKGYASRIVTPQGIPGPPRPFVARPPAPARARLGNSLAAGDGVPSTSITPLGSPSSPAPRPVIQHLPPHRAIGKGAASSSLTPLGAIGPPHPFVARKPGTRALTGRGGIAGGIASQAVTPSGAPSQPAPRPVIVHVPPHRAVWRGLASPNVTLQGTVGPPRPFIFRSPAPARGRAGNRGALAGGVASAVVTPPGLPSSPPPRPVIQHLPPRRVVWRGLASSIVTPSGALAPARKAQIFPPKVTRARIGTGTVAGGIASTNVTPPFVTFITTPQRPAPYIKRPAPARALTGRGGCASGIPSTSITPPLGSPSNPPARPVIQHLPPHRVVWRGLTVPPPVVTAYQRKPFVFRPPLPARARLGNGLATGGGYASTSITRQGTPGPPHPFVFRPPAPARGRLGNNLTAGNGIASPVVTPQGTVGPPKPSVWRSPTPARAKTGPRGTPAAGYVSLTGTSLGRTGPPRPSVFRPPLPARARLGSSTRPAAGLPGAITPQGIPGPPRPFVWRSPAPARSRLGSSPRPGAGIAGTITPSGAIGPPRVFVARKGPQRAITGRRTVAGGIASTGLTTPATPAPRSRVPQFPPKVTRATTGHSTTAGGLASTSITPLGSLPPARKVPTFPPKVTRAKVGPAGSVAGGTMGLTSMSPGFVPGPGMVTAADSQVMTTGASDWQVMATGAADWATMPFTAHDYEP